MDPAPKRMRGFHLEATIFQDAPVLKTRNLPRKPRKTAPKTRILDRMVFPSVKGKKEAYIGLKIRFIALKTLQKLKRQAKFRGKSNKKRE